MAAQVLDIRFCQFVADSGRNTTDAELQCTAVFDHRYDEAGNFIIHRCRRFIRDNRHIRIGAFYNHIYIGNVQFRFISQCLRHFLIDFYDDLISRFQDTA